jgi:hypothetical protein
MKSPNRSLLKNKKRKIIRNSPKLGFFNKTSIKTKRNTKKVEKGINDCPSCLFHNPFGLFCEFNILKEAFSYCDDFYPRTEILGKTKTLGEIL